MEVISAGISEKMRTVVDNSLLAAVKAIKIISKQKRSVETHAAHKLHKRSVRLPWPRVPVWDHFRAGTSTAVMVFAENSFTADVRETKTDSLIRIPVNRRVIRAEELLFVLLLEVVAMYVFCPDRKVLVGQPLFNGISMLRRGGVSASIMEAAKEMAIDLMTELRVRGPVFLFI